MLRILRISPKRVPRGLLATPVIALNTPMLRNFSESGAHTVPANVKIPSKEANPILDPLAEENEEELEDMFQPGPSLGQVEWGGPTRGGSRPEPTRYGDWDRNGRCSDF